MRKIGQNTVWIGATLVALILVGAIYFGSNYLRDDRGLPKVAEIGGPFSLVDHRGKSVTNRDYLGKPTLVFFGFTHCPDVCPTTLYEISNMLGQLKPDADRMNVLFITVDPERDTPEQLALYLSSFDPRITGLSGTSESIAAALDAYQVYSRKVPLKDGDYTMDHSAAIFMMDSKGQYVGTISHRETDAAMRATLRRVWDSAHSGGA